MTEYAEWGPLAGLVGEWEGDNGLDISWHNVEGELGETKFREKVSMKPFGPVANGTQSLYGLDYRMAAWRAGEENPFHTEVGYWLWDGAAGEVMRWDIPVKHSVVGETTIVLGEWPAELAVGAGLDYSNPRERNEGNGNSGHEYGANLSAAEKDDLVEFLKTF